MRKIVFILLACVTLVACSGPAPSDAIKVTLTDFQFTPNSFLVPAGQEITITANNNGAVEHNFVVMKLGTTAGDAWDDADIPNVFWKLQLEPGASQTDTFTAPTEPGEYQVVCSTPGHLMAGMIAKLVVVAGK